MSLIWILTQNNNNWTKIAAQMQFQIKKCLLNGKERKEREEREAKEKCRLEKESQTLNSCLK